MNKSKLIAYATLAVTVLGSGIFFAENSIAQVVPGSSAVVQVKRQRNERHPDLRAALNLLNRAHARLAKGSHDFGGHRAAAEKLTEQAIDQVQAALRDDKH